MSVRRFLIVNADDFGLTSGINRGIVTAHERGIVTSASLMVRWPGAVEAADYARGHPALSLGLHLDLGEWTVVKGEWQPCYEVVSLNDHAALSDEVHRQLDTFQRLVGRTPTHLDSHQHVHSNQPINSILRSKAREFGVVLRNNDRRVHYCGEFYGQSLKGGPYPEGISVDSLLRIIRALPPGITELGCHPGYETDLNSMYSSERSAEIHALCDPRVRSVLEAENVILCSFSDRVFSETPARETTA